MNKKTLVQLLLLSIVVLITLVIFFKYFNKEIALQNARDLYTRRNEGSCIWIVKSKNIISSESEDHEAFFDPSNDKIYRHPTFYKMPEGSKHI